VTDKAQRQAESRKVAIVDLQAVRHIAQVLNETPERKVALLSGGNLYDDPYLAQTLETGLVVTYARVFTDSQRYTPVPETWVPGEHEELHEELMTRRNRYHAHIDRAPANLHIRMVNDAGEGWFAVGFPAVLTSAQLEELEGLTRKLHRLLDADITRLEN
jgi:hypothetical protein